MLFCGGKFNSIQPLGNPVDHTGGTTFDSAYTDCSLHMAASTDQWQQDFTDASGASSSIVNGDTGYAHALIYKNTISSTAHSYLELRDASNFPWLSLRNVSSGVAGIYGNTGTGASPVWTLIGSTFTFTQGILYNCDIKFTHSTSNMPVEFSINGTLVTSGTISIASLPSLTRIWGGGRGTGNNTPVYFSQIMVTEGISTINGKVRYRAATGAGSNSGMTGAFTDVNEIINNDTTVLSAASVGLKSTFAMADVTVPSGFAIKSVFIWSRAKNDGTAPNNLKGVVRSGGTDYPMAANMTGMGTSFGARLDRRDNDPATGSPWTQAGWNAVEVGVQSET